MTPAPVEETLPDPIQPVTPPDICSFARCPTQIVTLAPQPPPPLDSIVITARPPVQGPVFGTGTTPDLEATVITSRPRLEVRPFRLEGPGGEKIIVGSSEGSRAPNVQIVGPRPIFLNVNSQGPARISETDLDRAELEALLRLARERVRELNRG